MAADYETLGGVGTIELLGGGQTHDVIQGTFRAIPSGVIFTLVIDRADWTPNRLKLIVPVVAAAANKAMAVDGVQDLQIYQTVNNAGQFVNHMDVLVTSTSGRSEVTIHPPYGSIFDADFEAAVSAAVANLDAVEAG